MDTKTFDALIDEIRTASLDTLAAKNARYARGDDRLHNFRVGASLDRSTPAQACWGYLCKHLVALRDMVKRNDFTDREDLKEKCKDAINYICFIWCIGNDGETAGASPHPTQSGEGEPELEMGGRMVSAPTETHEGAARADEVLETYVPDSQPTGGTEATAGWQALWSNPLDPKKTYRDVVAERAPSKVGLLGRIMGCPGDYLQDAPRCHNGHRCKQRSCYECWARPYRREEWIYD